jgi:hypothetical protein
MGKRNKLREAQRREDELALAARLRLHGRAKHRRAFINCYAEFPPEQRARIEAYRRRALRQPESWRCALRVRSPELRFLDLVKFTFARFEVAEHLWREWLGEPADGDAPDFRLWYIAAAQGGSLYHEESCHYLSRAETHHFLAAPDAMKTAKRALWYAVARARTDDAGLASLIARTKLVEFCFRDEFWKGVARFFARHPAGLPEMNDLIDFIRAAKADDHGFSLTGRTLPALRRRMEEWHERLRTVKELRQQRWAGKDQPNAVYQADEMTWRFKQIKNSIRLFEEGRRMRHCVLTYQHCCVGGSTSIWSLSCEQNGAVRRCLTIEVDNVGWIVQARGFANRAPTAAEREVLTLWASEFSLDGNGIIDLALDDAA